MTLVTGDLVIWEVHPDGTTAATVEAVERDGREASFETIDDGDDVYVIPSDVALLVGETLDRELFNVAGLIEQGYHDGAVDEVPLIVTAPQRAPAGPAGLASVSGLQADRVLSSVNGIAASVGHEQTAEFGRALAGAAEAQARTGAAGPLAGVGKVWLDRQVEVELHDSVAQTGAPEAWDLGFDGQGVTIAVLDTGIDESHADIGEVVAAENFSSSDTTDDGHGHGTHVAATAAGTGDASDGDRTGVAPGADLINAKVLNDAGSGSESDIIAGMEWAADDQGADVINMSLGGAPTDGTDPMSQAVNNIADEHGTLFVISAGNSGSSDQSVTTPGPADAALTVGAVDKDSALAWFSSRGPRVGDFAIKPDITAPGVGIVAARADGTSMGSPVDDDYTQASGTSMAAPHVAGAAAILGQANPGWAHDQLKAALVTTAASADGLTIYEQGGGELDIAAAIGADVLAAPAPLDLGYFEYPHDDTDPVTETVSYTNTGDDPVTLDLSVEVTDGDGDPAADGMVTVSPETLSIDPGETAEADVTVDPSVGDYALYGGAVTATDADGETVAAVPTGFYKEAEMFDLTVEGIARDGRDAGGISSFDVMNVDDRDEFFESSLRFTDGEATVRVPPGTYSVMGVIYTYDEPHVFTEERVMTGDPEVEVDGDTTITLDAREANEVVIDVPHDVDPQLSSVSYHRAPEEGTIFTHSWTGSWQPTFAVATDPVTQGAFEFYTEQTMSGEDDGGRWYELLLPEPDFIPADLHYTIGEDDVATIPTAFHSDVTDHEYNESRANWRPYQTVSISFTRRVDVPQERVEYVSAGDTRWRKTVRAEWPFTASMFEPITLYEGGEVREETWYKGPVTPGLLEGNDDAQPASMPVRDGDTLNFLIAEWSDAHPGIQRHWGWRHTSVDETAFRLFEDGELVGEADRPRGEFEVSSGPSRLRMEADVSRDADWWLTSTETRTAWEFDSEHADGAELLPLLLVDYDMDVDLRNRAPHPRDARGPFTIDLHARHPRGVDDAEIADLRVWISYDDGATWRERNATDRGDGRYRVRVDNRDPADTPTGFVSLRVEASDVEGNAIEQETIRAYGLSPRD